MEGKENLKHDERSLNSLPLLEIEANFIYGFLFKDIDFCMWSKLEKSFLKEIPDSRKGLLPVVNVAFRWKENSESNSWDYGTLYRTWDGTCYTISLMSSPETHLGSKVNKVKIKGLVGIRRCGACFVTIQVKADVAGDPDLKPFENPKDGSVQSYHTVDAYKILDLFPRIWRQNGDVKVDFRTKIDLGKTGYSLKQMAKSETDRSAEGPIFDEGIYTLGQIAWTVRNWAFRDVDGDHALDETLLSPFEPESGHDSQLPFVVLVCKTTLETYDFLRMELADGASSEEKEKRTKLLREVVGLAHPLLDYRYVEEIDPDQFGSIVGYRYGRGGFPNLTIAGIFLQVSPRCALIIHPDVSRKEEEDYNEHVVPAIIANLKYTFEMLQMQRFSLVMSLFYLEREILDLTSGDLRRNGKNNESQDSFDLYWKSLEVIRRVSASMLLPPHRYVEDAFLPSSIAIRYAESMFEIAELERSLVGKMDLFQKLISSEMYKFDREKTKESLKVSKKA
jgi:hypothetical protein